jgi:carbon monoxide dehydrogenase subunit G
VSALQIEETIHIAAPPEAAWKLLADPRGWRLWWPGCLEAETADKKTLHDGSKLRLRLKLGWLPTRLDARIEAATPPKILVWTAKGGLAERHAFYLEARPNGTFVREQQNLAGALLPLFRLLRLDRATRRMFQANLRGLKYLAERGS